MPSLRFQRILFDLKFLGWVELGIKKINVTILKVNLNQNQSTKNPQETADLVAFTEEILNGKLYYFFFFAVSHVILLISKVFINNTNCLWVSTQNCKYLSSITKLSDQINDVWFYIKFFHATCISSDVQQF